MCYLTSFCVYTTSSTVKESSVDKSSVLQVLDMIKLPFSESREREISSVCNASPLMQWSRYVAQLFLTWDLFF